MGREETDVLLGLMLGIKGSQVSVLTARSLRDTGDCAKMMCCTPCRMVMSATHLIPSRYRSLPLAVRKGVLTMKTVRTLFRADSTKAGLCNRRQRLAQHLGG